VHGEIVSRLVQLICTATPTQTREPPRGNPVTLQAGNLCPQSIGMSATAGALSPVLLYEALLEAGMSADTLSDLRSTVADGSAFIVGDGGGVDAGCPTYPAAGDADIHSASLLMSASLARIAEWRGSDPAAREADGADARLLPLVLRLLRARPFKPFGSKHNDSVRSLWQWPLQRLTLSVILLRLTSTTPIHPHARVQHTLRAPVRRQRGRLHDTSPAALCELQV
jgi:hypothetical protein